MKNKRGKFNWTVALLWGLFILIFASIAISYAETELSLFEDSPGLVSRAFEMLGGVLSPIAEAIFIAVAPAGQSENVQVIAFSIFLLLFLVGSETLGKFFNNAILTWVVSGIVGIIASRSLTQTILEDTALAASPIATASLLLGFIPILALTKNIDRWGLNQYSKVVVFAVSGAVYWIVFWVAFDAWSLGAVYGSGIIAIGAFQNIAGFWKKTQKQRQAQGLGRYMAGVQDTVETVKGMSQGASNP